jgi:uncharacterized Rmd1/YagE family protein
MYRFVNRLMQLKSNKSSVKLLFNNKHKLLNETNVKNICIINNSTKQLSLQRLNFKYLSLFNQRVEYFSNAKNDQKFKSKTEKTSIEDRIQTKKRSLRKKVNVKKNEQMLSVVAFSTAEEYNLEFMSEAIKEQGLYELTKFDVEVEDCLHLSAKYKLNHIQREVFIFRSLFIIYLNLNQLLSKV